MSTARTSLVIGGYGALGSAIADELAKSHDAVFRTTRKPRPDDHQSVALGAPHDFGTLAATLPRLDAVVWAQGVNVNDSAEHLAIETFSSVLEVNVTLVASTLSQLVETGRLRDGARLVVVSSMWEVLARPGKFSYTVSKAALGGLVRAAAADLASRNILINAVLPGVIDTPMTRRMLSPEEIAQVEAGTSFGRLLAPEDIAKTVAYLCSPANTGVTGQSIAVDLGFSSGRSL